MLWSSTLLTTMHSPDVAPPTIDTIPMVTASSWIHFKNDITRVTYPYQTLVAFNVSYNNGGGGGHVFTSSNITVATKTALNNPIDPFNNACCRPQIDVNNGDNNVILNNIAYGIPATTAEDARCEGTQPCTITFVDAFLGGNGGGGTDNNNVWQ